MLTHTIKCLIYRYNRIRERLCAVIVKGSQFIALNEIDYNANKDFFLDSKFTKFIGYTSGCSFDLCIISQSESQGEEFVALCKKYYNYNDIGNTVWTEEYIRNALLSLDLKKSLIVGNIFIEGNNRSRPDIAFLHINKKSEITVIDDNKEVYKPNEELSLLEESDIAFVKNTQTNNRKCNNKSKLSLAMEKIIKETYDI